MALSVAAVLSMGMLAGCGESRGQQMNKLAAAQRMCW